MFPFHRKTPENHRNSGAICARENTTHTAPLNTRGWTPCGGNETCEKVTANLQYHTESCMQSVERWPGGSPATIEVNIVIEFGAKV